MNFALIPARGGSKRIKNKNIKRFQGKPLIAYSIATAQQSGLFDKIIVSTDCQETANIALALGAEVPFMRPSELADDFSGTREVIEHAIVELAAQGLEFEYCCCIYATAPFLQPKYLKLGLDLLQQQPNKAFAFSVTSYDFPVQRALKVSKNGMAPMFPAFVDARSQDLEEAMHDAGQFYWGSTANYLSKKPLFSEHALGVRIPRNLVQDIDTPEDWDSAELMYMAYINKTKTA